MLPSAAKAQGTEVRDIALSLVVVEVIALQAVRGVLTLVHSVGQAMLRPPSTVTCAHAFAVTCAHAFAVTCAHVLGHLCPHLPHNG